MGSHTERAGARWRFKPDLTTQRLIEIAAMLRKDAVNDCVTVELKWDRNVLAAYHFTYSTDLEISDELSPLGAVQVIQDWRRETKASLRKAFKDDFID